jgi:hypothetical protein
MIVYRCAPWSTYIDDNNNYQENRLQPEGNPGKERDNSIKDSALTPAESPTNSIKNHQLLLVINFFCCMHAILFFILLALNVA